jgi:hypothetical protein
MSEIQPPQYPTHRHLPVELFRREMPAGGGTSYVAPSTPDRETEIRPLSEQFAAAIGSGHGHGVIYRDVMNIVTAREAALQARLDAVLAVCDAGEHQAIRWEQPYPVPAWVTDVRAATEGRDSDAQ